MDTINKIRNEIDQGVRSTFIPLVAIILALLAGAGIIAAMGISPWEAYRSMLLGALGNRNAIAETLVKTAPLIFTGLSFAIAKQCGLINIGAEGQLYMGGFLSVAAGIYLTGLPIFIHLPLALLAGFVGGGIWGFISGWLKIRFGASEIITTVMLNYVAQYWVSYMVTGPMKEPPGTMPQSAPVAVAAQLPRILPPTRLHLGIIVAVLAIIFYYIFLWRTTKGYELRVVGRAPDAASYAGMVPGKSIVLAMFLAGGMGGLAGSGEILGIQHRLLQGFSPGYGFDGIAVALLGRGSPIGVFLGAVLFGVLRAGGNMMQMVVGVPVAVIYTIQALVIMFVVAEYLFSVQNRQKISAAIRQAFRRSDARSEDRG